MSVPLDRLYHYLGDVVNHDLLIYRWMPHGSRKLEDLYPLMIYPESKWVNCPIVIFHDQESLNYNFYSQDQICNRAKEWFEAQAPIMLNDSVLNYVSQQHLRGATGLSVNNYDSTILVHSEQHSMEIDVFEQAGFVPVYYWSHAVIARDWFRYAEHDVQLDPTKKHTVKDFLIYNRAWAGTREYRLYFTEQIAESGLSEHCQMAFNPHDHGGHYSQHQFVNPAFQEET